MMRTRPTTARLIAAAAVTLASASTLLAQLREPEVLVVYDSRVSDSVEVARTYAGSAKVPGGTGIVAGTRPGVRVVDLASLPSGGVGQVTSDIDYPTFVASLRDPLKTYLQSTGLTRTVRCLVMTRGLPHRILNVGASPTLGDNPGGVGGTLCSTSNSTLTYASVDAELTLLQQDLAQASPSTNVISSRSGMIINPYWKAAAPITAYDTTNIAATKSFTLAGSGFQCEAGGTVFSFNGVYWLTTGIASVTAQLTPGDIYLVSRLDAATLAGTQQMIARAANINANVGSSAFVLDKDSQNFDSAGVPAPLSAGADYQLAATLLATTDRRFLPANVRFNTADLWAGFLVGPGFSFAPSTPIVVTTPVLLLASYGANHLAVNSPTPRIDSTPFAGTWGTSFTFAPGAAFNTFESYNGRAFNGLGQNPFVVHQQAADVLDAGATLAIAHVWEPLSWTVADNVYLAQNFYAGNLSWAEAAWSAIPVLSWQHIVLGDPLARIRRSSEDRNADGRVDLDDLYAWRAAPVDLNNSGTADETDYRLLENAVRGPEHATMRSGR